jgi:hypothetical protein
VIAALLALGGVFLILQPLVRRKYRFELEDMFAAGDVRQLNYLNAKKAMILENIKELDFEYEMDKLSEEDYTALRNDYLKEAQQVVEAIEKLKIREEIEELIESEVRSRRRIQ